MNPKSELWTPGSTPQAVIPYVVESSNRGERVYDIYSRLLRDRIVFLGTPIDDQVANAIVAQFLFLDHEDPERDIQFYIHSPGGSVTAGLAVYDTMQFVRPNIVTLCVGLAASMATVLLCAGCARRRVEQRIHPLAPGQAKSKARSGCSSATPAIMPALIVAPGSVVKGRSRARRARPASAVDESRSYRFSFTSGVFSAIAAACSLSQVAVSA